MEFGNVSWEDGAKRGDTEARTACSKDYMLKRRNVQADRIVVMIGGYRQHSTVEFWLVRRGESEPTPKPTVNPKDVSSLKETGEGVVICSDVNRRFEDLLVGRPLA